MPDDALFRDILVRSTAWLSFLGYMLTLVGWTRCWPAYRLRWLWTLAWVIFVIHVGLAFQLVHHWSHHEAWEATRLQGGFGDGVYLNYLVIAVWSVDVLWWWLSRESYLRRRRWIFCTLHGVLLFIWINAAVFFAHWPMNIGGGLFFFLLGYSTWYRSKPG